MAKEYYRPRYLLLWGKSKKKIATPVVWGPSVHRVSTVVAHFAWSGWFVIMATDKGIRGESLRSNNPP
jgi:hypothetical protein